jgi:GTPase SAR1 family protein
LIQLLLKLATGQLKMAFGRKHRVVIVGPTNVGKSTLYNQLVRRKEDQADVSPLPGTTGTTSKPTPAYSPSSTHPARTQSAKRVKTNRNRPCRQPHQPTF